jgi:hypothetical protein
MSAEIVLFQALPPLSPEEYRDLELDILDRGVLVPIIVDEHGVVTTGRRSPSITTCRARARSGPGSLIPRSAV